ncbi:MAG: sigma-70 family RNA polymerase sigma factor [Bdellovibrionales bacterium]|nr:sigma-70 family RNA polymerase sigma factor [Bdellovibrionales bacterium]
MKKKRKKGYPAEVIRSRSPVVSDPMQLYLKEISQFPVLSKKEEEKLSKQFYETKDPHIARLLAQANLRFVVKIAAEYTRFGARLIDLVQEGNVGLLHAIKEFNPYKEVRLITYAVWWIRGYIQEYLLRQYSLVRIGTSAKQRKLFYLLRKQQEQLNQALPYKSDTQQLLTHSGFKEKEVQDMRQRLDARDLSLDQPLSENSTSTLLDIQPQVEEESMEDNLSFFQEEEMMLKSIKNIRPQLNTKELFILDKRLLSNHPLTLQEIGKKFSVTREAIRQVESRLIKKIKDQMVDLLQN